jgi:hypothetical protein
VAVSRAEDACKFVVNGKTYDLSGLTVAAGAADYKASDANKFDYYFNLCASVTTTHGCASSGLAQFVYVPSGACKNLASTSAVPTARPYGTLFRFPAGWIHQYDPPWHSI